MGGTILYIDDENQLPAGFVEELQAEGYRLLHSSDPDEALVNVRVEEIDLVLMEVLLSTCNGMGLMEEIRSYGGWPAEVPIIVLTRGERSPELYGGALELGAKEFLTKPALKAELLESVLQFAGKVSEATEVDPSQSGSVPETEAALSGELDETPISELLHRLRQDAATGVLTVTHAEQRRAIELRNGSPVAVSSRDNTEALEDFLVRRGLINLKQRKAVKQRVAKGEGGSGEILLSLGALSEEELSGAVSEQADEQLLQTFRWTSGAFRYFDDKKVKSDVALEIDRNPAELIVEGVLDWSPQRPVSDALRKRASLYVSTVDEPPCDWADLPLSSSQRVFFEHMYGDRSVQEVLDAGELDERTIYGLFVAGLLVLHEDPVVMLLEELGPSDGPPQSREPEAPAHADTSEVASPDCPEPLPPAGEPLAPPPEEPMPFIEPSAMARMGPQPDAPAPLPPPDAEPIGVTLQEESALAELTSFCERIRSGDDFDVLGIAEEASDEEVGVAYQALVDSLLPDLGLGAEPRLKELADEARKRLDRASDRLGKASSRNVYAALRHPAAKARRGGPAGKAPEIEELAARGLDAETWFRKGEGFLKARKFDAAVEAFGMAAHLDPKEGEYVARLGYALFLSNPKAPVVVREALEHISKGIKLSPKREKPYVYLGKIFRESGAPDRARKMLEYAVRIKPDCPSALHELKLLDELEGKDSGVLNRLRGLFN